MPLTHHEAASVASAPPPSLGKSIGGFLNSVFSVFSVATIEAQDSGYLFRHNPKMQGKL